MPKPTIAIDFDGTLVEHDRHGQCFLVSGAREALIRLRASGVQVVIHTCRMGIARKNKTLDEEVAYVEARLTEFGIPYDSIFLGEKLVADVYVDDRAVPFEGDWGKTLDQVVERLAAGEDADAGK